MQMWGLENEQCSCAQDLREKWLQELCDASLGPEGVVCAVPPSCVVASADGRASLLLAFLEWTCD